jgi:hypothetical protein
MSEYWLACRFSADGNAQGIVARRHAWRQRNSAYTIIGWIGGKGWDCEDQHEVGGKKQKRFCYAG